MSPKERLARDVAQRLRQAGFTAYFAGGCVRDRLMGHEPDDYDIATDAGAETVQSLFPRTVPVGVQFGVILVILENEAFEVATFRSDDVYLDGRHPSAVHFGSPQEDAQRRDFTINGMFLDPATDTVLDYVGGQADLQAGIIRAIGEPAARIAEDRLRMLRAVRFAARFGFQIEAATFAALKHSAAQIIDIAWERIGDEIVKMLVDGPPGSARTAFELLDEAGLLQAVLPEVAAMKSVPQSPDYHPEGDVFVHTLGLLQRLERPSEPLALAALLHDVAKPQCLAVREHRITFYGHCEQGAVVATEVCKRLRRSRETWERVAYLVKNHLRHTSAPEMRASTLKRFLREEGIEELLELARLDALASRGDLTTYEFCRARREEMGDEVLRPVPLLTGRDLIALGLRPGPEFGALLEAALDAQLEGVLVTRDDALAWVAARTASTD